MEGPVVWAKSYLPGSPHAALSRPLGPTQAEGKLKTDGEGKQEHRVVMLLEQIGARQVASLTDIPPSPSRCGWGQLFGLGVDAILRPKQVGLWCLSLLSQQPPLCLPAGEKLASAGLGLTGRQPPAQAPWQE